MNYPIMVTFGNGLWLFLSLTIFPCPVSTDEVVDSPSLNEENDSVKACIDPKDIKFGRRQPEYVQNGMMPEGSQLHFVCKPGYRMFGSSKMVCGNKGSWEPPTKPICRPVECQEPQINHGRIVRGKPGHIYPGKVVQVVCDEGYRLKDKSADLLECGMSGSWMQHYFNSDDLALCVAHTCTAPPQLPNSDVQVEGDVGWDSGYEQDSIAIYQCNYGFQIEDLRGNRLLCRNGRWQPEYEDVTLSKCVQGGCSRPLPVANGNFAPHLDTVYSYETIVTYYCYSSYTLAGRRYTFQCRSDGNWTPPMRLEYLPTCEHHSGSGCEDPAYILHGRIMKINGTGPRTNNLYTENTVVRYACEPGYRLQDCGTDWIICKEGRWVNPLPLCVELHGCGQPPTVPFATVTHHDPPPTLPGGDSHAVIPLYTKIHYKCLTGFTLLGTPDLTCGVDGCWAPNLPQCVLLGPQHESPEWKEPASGSASGGPAQGDYSWSDTHLMTVSVATAGSIIGALFLVQLLVVFQRRKCCLFHRQRLRRHHQHQRHRPRRTSSTASSLASSPCRLPPNHDPDRVALIAFADGVQVVLPTYEEAIRQSGPPPFDSQSQRGHGNRGFLPNLPSTRRPRVNPTTITRDNSTETTTQGESGNSSSATQSNGVDSMGSTDTVATSEVSTTVTLDTLSSTASNMSQPLSCRAMCGSLTSFDTNSLLNNEGVPLLEEVEAEAAEADGRHEDEEIVRIPVD